MCLTNGEKKERLILRKIQLESLIDFVKKWLEENQDIPELLVKGAYQLVERAESEIIRILAEIGQDSVDRTQFETCYVKHPNCDQYGGCNGTHVNGYHTCGTCGKHWIL